MSPIYSWPRFRSPHELEIKYYCVNAISKICIYLRIYRVQGPKGPCLLAYFPRLKLYRKFHRWLAFRTYEQWSPFDDGLLYYFWRFCGRMHGMLKRLYQHQSMVATWKVTKHTVENIQSPPEVSKKSSLCFLVFLFSVLFVYLYPRCIISDSSNSIPYRWRENFQGVV